MCAYTMRDWETHKQIGRWTEMRPQIFNSIRKIWLSVDCRFYNWVSNHLQGGSHLTTYWRFALSFQVELIQTCISIQLQLWIYLYIKWGCSLSIFFVFINKMYMKRSMKRQTNDYCLTFKFRSIIRSLGFFLFATV